MKYTIHDALGPNGRQVFSISMTREEIQRWIERVPPVPETPFLEWLGEGRSAPLEPGELQAARALLESDPAGDRLK